MQPTVSDAFRLFDVEIESLWNDSPQTELKVAVSNRFDCLPFCVCLFVVLHPSNIYGHIRMSTNLSQCTFMATLLCCLTGTPGHQHHDMTSHSVIFSWHWTNHSLPYNDNAGHQVRKRQVSILTSMVLLNQGSNPPGSDSPNTKMELLLIWSG